MALPLSILSQAMQQACREARLWLGATSPNPPVGAAALDEKGSVLAVAAHHKAGQDHAERALIKLCRDRGLLDRVHTLCVTLTPCNHFGKTPPCCDIILESGIKHIAIGATDPNPSVRQGAIDRLRDSGVDVVLGCEEDLCRQLIYAFATHVGTRLPWITVKRAFDEKGAMRPPAGQKTFTSHESLVLAHKLRKRCDAILTGSGTILADDPSFTVRHVSDHEDKVRYLAILDRRRRVSDAWLLAVRGRGFIPVIYHDIRDAIDDLARRNVQDVLVEAGPELSRAIMQSGLWHMDAAICAGKPDHVEVSFNPAQKIPFDMANWQWPHVLPV
ncbi:MAG: bifunctional diaminohydroxyphosphoribosylaminopyrimidine deaminase/5-amino-6-(5-phosphoribosylamino)uracil reductase RibD [Alphaproteobacteria bacterium]|nr:bifunctional diaminohydroxyphosphoribosylaminopyrimidine deaminase/5-amino-6-(5-phosphoribosylamino)uracil reductase RibD [Alphaproteobacteria bacterium]